MYMVSSYMPAGRAQLRSAAPGTYGPVRFRNALHGMGQVADPNFGASSPPQKPSIWDNLSTILAGGFNIYNQQKIANENIKRAREGLAPLDAVAIGAVPTANVNAGLDPGTQNFLMWALIGGGALVLVSMLRK